MAGGRKLEVQITGDASSLERAFRSAAGATGTFGSSLARVGKIAAFAIGGAAIGGLALTLRAGAKEWMEHAKVAAQTEQVLKTTGGVAGVTQKHVEDLAQTMLRKTGIDDEAIQSSENLLLSFTNVRNEAGKGNDVFDRATKVIQDYSVRTGKSATQATMLFGKTLQEVAIGKIPTSIRGLGKLSDAQVKQMKTMVAAGHVSEAQGVILKMLEQRYGGAAEAAGNTLPGKINILKESFRNLSAEIFARLVPALTQIVNWTTAHWPQIEAVFKATFAAIGTAVQFGVHVIRDFLIPAGEAVVAWFQTNWPRIEQITMDTFNKIAPIVVNAFNTIKAVVQGAVTTILAIWNTFGPQIMAQVRAVWTFVQSYIQGVLNVIRGIVNIFGGLLHGDWSRVWLGIQQLFGGIWQSILAVLRLQLATLRNVLSAALAALGALWSATWNKFTGIVRGVWGGVVGAIRGAIGSVLSAARAVGLGILRGVSAGITGLVKMVQGWFQSLWAWIKGAAGSAYAFALNIGRQIVQGVADGIIGAAKAAFDAASKFVSGVKARLEFWHSPPEAYGFDVGSRLVKGLTAGIMAGFPQAANAVERGKQLIKARLQAQELVRVAEQWGRIIGAANARAILQGFIQTDQSLKSQFIAAAKQKALDMAQASKDARGAFISAFNDLANAALAAFDAKMAAWKPPSLKLLEKMQLEDQIKQLTDALGPAVASAEAALVQALASGNKAGIARAQNELNAALNTQYQAVLTQQNALVATAAANLAAAEAEGDPEKIKAAQAAYDQALADQTAAIAKYIADSRALIEQNLQWRADAEQRTHDAVAAKQREGLAKRLEILKQHLLEEPKLWSTMGTAVQKILTDYNVKLKTAGQAWANQFAQGIVAGTGAAVAAAKAMAAAVDAVIPHSPAKEGPLAYDIYDVGKKWAQGFGRGINAGMSTPAMAGVSLSRGGGMALPAGGGGVNVYVTVQGALLGSSVPEVAETIRRELLRTKSRNGTSGL